MGQPRHLDEHPYSPDAALHGKVSPGRGGAGTSRPDHSGAAMSTMTEYEHKQHATQAVQAALDRRDGGGSSRH